MTLKVETLNPVRSFKGRGAETVAPAARETGASKVVCASAGNLGLRAVGAGTCYTLTRVGLAVNETAGARPRERATEPRDLSAIAENDRPPGEDPLEHHFECVGHRGVDLDARVEGVLKKEASLSGEY